MSGPRTFEDSGLFEHLIYPPYCFGERCRTRLWVEQQQEHSSSDTDTDDPVRTSSSYKPMEGGNGQFGRDHDAKPTIWGWIMTNQMSGNDDLMAIEQAALAKRTILLRDEAVGFCFRPPGMLVARNDRREPSSADKHLEVPSTPDNGQARSNASSGRRPPSSTNSGAGSSEIGSPTVSPTSPPNEPADRSDITIWVKGKPNLDVLHMCFQGPRDNDHLAGRRVVGGEDFPRAMRAAGFSQKKPKNVYKFYPKPEWGFRNSPIFYEVPHPNPDVDLPLLRDKGEEMTYHYGVSRANFKLAKEGGEEVKKDNVGGEKK